MTAPSPQDQRRALGRILGLVLLVLGLYFLSNSAVMLFGRGASLADEAPWLIPGFILGPVGAWLLLHGRT